MMKILNTSWGGHGEHGILEVFMNMDGNKLTLSLCDSAYNDWGAGNLLTDKRTYSKSFDIDTNKLTRKYLYECIMDVVENECNITCYKIKEDICF